LQRIWREQAVSPALVEAITTFSKAVHEGILTSSNGKNVTEWCKKEECWYAIRSLDLALPPALEAELVTEKHDAPGQPSPNGSTGSNGKPAETPTLDDGPADNRIPL